MIGEDGGGIDLRGSVEGGAGNDPPEISRTVGTEGPVSQGEGEAGCGACGEGGHPVDMGLVPGDEVVVAEHGIQASPQGELEGTEVAALLEEVILGPHEGSGTTRIEAIPEARGRDRVCQPVFPGAAIPPASQAETRAAAGESEGDEEIIPLLFESGFE